MPRLTNLALLMAALIFVGCGSDNKDPVAPNVPSPSDLRATILSNSSIRLNWVDNSPNEAGFRIDRAPAGGDNYTHLPNLEANTTTFTDTGLVEGSVFNYRVVAFSGVTISPSDPLPVAVPLITPTSFVGQRLSPNSIGLTWVDGSSNETAYQVDMKIRGEAEFERLADLSANESAFTAEGLIPRTFYQFRVRAAKDTVASLWSNVITVQTTVLTPNPPSELAASTSSGRPNAVSLTWFDNSGNEDGFIIDMSLSEGFGWAPVDTGLFDVDRIIIRSLTAETVYFFRVYAYNSFGNSEYSNVVSIEVPGVPAAPSGLTANAPDYRGVDLTWMDNSRNETEFYIERRLASNPNWTRIVITAPDTTRYFDNSVLQNLTYAYRIQAHNDAGSSAYTDEVEVTVPDGPPAGPVSMNANGVDIDKIIVSWNDVANNETVYFLERKLRDAAEFEIIAFLDPNQNVYTDTALTPETFYEYRAFCENTYGQSPYSNVATARTQSLTIFTESFESGLTDGPADPPWGTQTLGTSWAKISNRRGANESTKSLQFHDPDVGDNAAIVSRGNMNVRQASFKTWLYLPANSHFGVLAGDASANSYITWQIQFNDDNSFFVRDGAGLVDPGGTYPLNQWFELEVAFSTDSSEYAVYFNGALVTSDTLKLQRDDHVPNGQVIFLAFSDQELYDGYVDDVSMIRYWAGAEDAPRPIGPVLPAPIFVGEGPKRLVDAMKAPFVPTRR